MDRGMHDELRAWHSLGQLLIVSGVAKFTYFHRGGPRMEDEPIRPITDVVVTESVIGSLT
jgi:hypothetical protein